MYIIVTNKTLLKQQRQRLKASGLYGYLSSRNFEDTKAEKPLGHVWMYSSNVHYLEIE